MPTTRIRELRCVQVSGPASIEALEERQLQMLDIYPELARRGPGAGADRVTGTYVEVLADDGTAGLFGPIFEETAPIILAKLASHIVGQDPLAYERIWDVLYRQDRHARKGYEMMAISAVDCAVWDLRGKLLGLPVYRLLGGPTRERVDCYASMLGNSLDPGLVRARAQAVVEQGYRAQKWFFRYGPSDGLEGMARNVALVRTIREAVGPTVDIMFDCFMGGDATYIIRLLERIAEFAPRWLEEPVPPDRIADYVAIKRSTRVPIAAGEHEYTRWGFLQLLQVDALDVLQADPDWCGGITELVKICTLASAFGRPVFPHGHSIHPALHVIAAQSPGVCPMAEFLIRPQAAKQALHTRQLWPEHGSIALPDTPGLGIELAADRIDTRRLLTGS
ncbi:MAG TPA: enolase C-terminal domain-like protein [Chloroflexota bacterium]|nr:enolase C-terminal domain-like protein [Chloroflexota bacterium]